MKKRILTMAITVICGVSMITGSALATDIGAEVDPVPDGWDGSSYYQDGQLVKDKKITIDGKLYYFNKSGVAQKKGFFKFNGYKYYSKGNGELATGYYKVGNTPYFFNSTGVTKGKGFFKYKGKEYYSMGYGKLATGFKALKYKKKPYGFYFSKKSGAMAKNTVVGHLKIPKDGRLHEAYYYGIKVLNKNGWTLRAAYKYSYKTKYQGRWYRVHKPKNLRSEKYSLKGFKKRKGNCYVMAAEFYVMAKLLGYNIRQVHGRVGLPHSWTEIKHGKKIYVYDPNFRNETGRNGWKIWYGKKGTWRYSKKGRLNNFVNAK